ncbi:hypothetical protein ACQJ1Z_28285, partial [Klebsiella pneumoniae]
MKGKRKEKGGEEKKREEGGRRENRGRGERIEASDAMVKAARVKLGGVK